MCFRTPSRWISSGLILTWFSGGLCGSFASILEGGFLVTHAAKQNDFVFCALRILCIYFSWQIWKYTKYEIRRFQTHVPVPTQT